MPILQLTATIPAGQSLSDSINCGDNYLVGLVTPTSWTTAHVTVQVSIDNVTFFDVFSISDPDSTSPEEFRFNVVPGVIMAIAPDKLLMGQYVRFRSGTRDRPVPQPETRAFSIITSNKI